jgi:hypothetical protein
LQLPEVEGTRSISCVTWHYYSLDSK